MRRTLLGLAALAATVAGACHTGDGDGEVDAAGGSGGANLCDVMRAAIADSPESQQEFVDDLRTVDPPDEIETDFERFVEGMQAIVDEAEGNPTDLEEDAAAYEEAGERVDEYVERECDLGGDRDR